LYQTIRSRTIVVAKKKKGEQYQIQLVSIINQPPYRINAVQCSFDRNGSDLWKKRSLLQSVPYQKITQRPCLKVT